MPRKTAAKPGAKPRKRRKKVEAGTIGLTPAEAAAGATGIEDLAQAVEQDGGVVLGRYREPLGGHPILFAALPLGKVQPTPYQRDLSEAHVKKLATSIEKVGQFLDPVIAVRHDGGYWTPNGSHRLAAMRVLGGKAIVALLLPDPRLAFQILALNTEKAHNLKERSLEVIRMERGMVGASPSQLETEVAPMLEEPAFATLGICYERRPRFSGGAYHPVVKRCEQFLAQPLSEALPVREARADKLLRLDDLVVEKVAALKARGFESPYLKNFVVARANPLRFSKAEGPGFDATLDKMIAAVGRMDADAVKKEDIARMGGGAPSADEE